MYLTESKLKDYLKIIYPNHDFIHDKKVPNSGINNRPDYRNDELMLIVEFDGYLHYTQPSTIIADKMKDKIYSNMGYKIVRIPYFIQMSTLSISYLFDEYVNITQNYKHGFIDSKCILPAAFCEMGLCRYRLEFGRLDYKIKIDILDSIQDKIVQLGNKDLVIPWSEQ